MPAASLRMFDLCVKRMSRATGMENQKRRGDTSWMPRPSMASRRKGKETAAAMEATDT